MCYKRDVLQAWWMTDKSKSPSTGSKVYLGRALKVGKKGAVA